MDKTSQTKDSTSAAEYSQQHETITSIARISMVLRPLMEKHAIITATLPGCNRFFTTALLSVDLQDSTITIDGLHPEKGHALFLDIGRLTLRTTHDGVEVNFSVKLKRADADNDMAYYVLEFPEKIRYLQRRAAFRVPVSAAKKIRVEIETDEKRLFTGELSDISAGGMCIRLPKKEKTDLSEYQETMHCCTHLPDKRKIRCAFKVCHSTYSELSDSLHVGGCFEHLDKIQRRTIERFVVELQRLSRKSIAR